MVSLTLKPFSTGSGQFQILTKMPNFILWNGKNKKHTVLCEIKVLDMLAFLTGNVVFRAKG